MSEHSFLTHDRFLLGTFSSNCSGGMTVSKLPERWVANWKNNLALGQMLDEAGIDFMLPIARWIGYGGDTDFRIGGKMRACTGVIRLRICGPAEAEQGHEEVAQPADKQHRHHEVDVQHEVINAFAVRGGIGGRYEIVPETHDRNSGKGFKRRGRFQPGRIRPAGRNGG